MKTITPVKIEFHPLLRLFAVAFAVAALSPEAHANVYATDIKIDGSLSSITNTPTPSTPASITYILNQKADLGCTVAILNGNTTVATIGGGTAVGVNTVSWGGTNQAGSPVGSGNYTVSITASASDLSGGTTNWTQISVDSTNTAAVFPQGMDVDKNTNSPYYGRVIVGNAFPSSSPVNGVMQSPGLYKANADGSPADEGAFGYANYTTNDNGDVDSGEMPFEGSAFHEFLVPSLIRIGGDDRIYFIDLSLYGAVVACDMEATTNQLVICEGAGNTTNNLPASIGFPNSPNSYSNNPDGGLLNQTGEGWGQFDVAGFATGHPALYLCDTGDAPSAGIWMYHLTNGAADSNDSTGTQVVAPNLNPPFVPASIVVTSGGLMVDDHLDVFASDDRSSASTDTGGDPSVICNRVFDFTNWNNGALPADNTSTNDAYLNGTLTKWGVGTLSDQLSGINDTVINSRSNPTLVAVAMLDGSPLITNGYGGANSGIAILNAADGSFVATNLDVANAYTSVAFDNVGNVYGCSTSTNYWRVWSPPGANTNTTVAVAQVIVPGPFQITSITAVPTGGGCSTITISFSYPGNVSASIFQVVESATVAGLNSSPSTVAGAVITGSNGSYQATFTNCSTEFYQIKK